MLLYGSCCHLLDGTKRRLGVFWGACREEVPPIQPAVVGNLFCALSFPAPRLRDLSDEKEGPRAAAATTWETSCATAVEGLAVPGHDRLRAGVAAAVGGIELLKQARELAFRLSATSLLARFHGRLVVIQKLQSSAIHKQRATLNHLMWCCTNDVEFRPTWKQVGGSSPAVRVEFGDAVRPPWLKRPSVLEPGLHCGIGNASFSGTDGCGHAEIWGTISISPSCLNGAQQCIQMVSCSVL